MSVYLIADSRERAVIPFLEDDTLGGFGHIVRQVATGDFLICERQSGGDISIRACIERKTHADFAASFKDDRWANLSKMLALRTATGCQLFWFLEGPAFPSPTRQFARVPFSRILAAATKMMVRDGIFIIQTENEKHTADRLVDLMKQYAAVPAPPRTILAPEMAPEMAPETAPEMAPETAPETAPEMAPEVVAGAGGSDELLEFICGAPAARVSYEVPDILTARIPRSLDDDVIHMWMTLRGVSVVLGKILSTQFSIADLATGVVEEKKLNDLKTATGRPINKDARASLYAVRRGDHAQSVRLVSGINGITVATAAILVSTLGMAGLCSSPPEIISEVQIPRATKTSRLGKACADRLYKALHWVRSPPEI